MKTFNALVKPFRLFLVLITPTLFAQDIQWEQLNGPFGGTALSFASNNSGYLFAGTDENQGGIFRSTDGGITWQRKNSGLLNYRAYNWFVVDDSSYIITGSHNEAKVYKSKDNGGSWEQISILGGTSVAVNDSGHIYVGNTGYGQYSVSKDAGYSWTHYPHPSPFINCVAINDIGHIFIGGNYTGYRSKDNGANWTTLSLPDGINSIAFSPNGSVFAGCSRESASNSGVFRSVDNGDTWVSVKEGFRVYASNNIVINDNGEIFVGTWGWGIWKSNDNGNTWTQHNSGLGHFYIKSMHISNDGNVYAGLSGSGVYRSSDMGESWQQVGLTIAEVKKIAISPVNGNFFALVNGISRTTDNGQSWGPVNNGLVSFDARSLTIKNDGTIFCGFAQNNYGVVYRSIDFGDNWIRSDTGIQNQTVEAMTVDTAGNIYAANYYGIYKSTNNGSSWNLIGPPGYDFKPSGLAFNSNGDLFMASASSGIWRLTHGDTTWYHLYTGNSIHSLFCGSNDYLYAANMRSIDNGVTWTSMNVDWFTSSFAENSNSHLFCGTFNYGNGVYRSTDYGDTWTKINSGLLTWDIRSVAVAADDYLYAGTNGHSIYKTTKPTVSAVEITKTEPTTFFLENYPNPCKASTVIRWQNPVGCHQTLKIYDIFGREILTLVNEYKPAGKHETELNGASLPDGIYFYELKVGKFIGIKKMIVLK